MAMQYDTPIPTGTFTQDLYQNAGVSTSTADAISALLGLNDPSSTSVNVAEWDGLDPSTIEQPAGVTPDVLALAVQGGSGDNVTITLPDNVAGARVIIINSDANVTLTVGEEVNPNARVAAANDLVLQGGNGNDILTVLGNSNTRLDGGDGNDVLTTGGGNDVVIGGTGHNTIDTGAGNDTVIVGAGNDLINTGEGRDLIQVQGSKADYDVQVIGNTLSLSGSGAADGKTADIQNAEFLTFNDGHTLAIVETTEEAAALQLYQGLLNRDSDNGGAEFFTSQIQNGATLDAVANDFLNSDEYIANSSAQTVQSLYSSLLGHSADQAGEEFWSNSIKAGASSGDIAALISGSFEAQTNAATDADYINALYVSALGHDAEQAGSDFWTNALTSGSSRTDVANTIFASPDALAKASSDFVESLYQNALGRASDEAGKAYWTEALEHGSSEATIAIAIVGSPEAQDHITNVVVVHGTVV